MLAMLALAGCGGGGGSIAQTCVAPPAIDQPAAKLSQTGCMSPSDTKTMAASVLPYDVNSPLWSDGADKQRGMALPLGGKIHVKDCTATPAECPQGAADDGKWELPVGTVMVKSFLFDGKLVETRLFVHLDAGTWAGYSYEWDEAQTDATIVADERVELAFDTGQRTVTWHLPNRMDCMTCHTPTGGSTLGPETAQMNRIVGGMNRDRSPRCARGFRSRARDALQGRPARSRNVPGHDGGARPIVPARQLRLLPSPRRPELPHHRPAVRCRVQGHEDL